jgi:hypothetical protein
VSFNVVSKALLAAGQLGAVVEVHHAMRRCGLHLAGATYAQARCQLCCASFTCLPGPLLVNLLSCAAGVETQEDVW